MTTAASISQFMALLSGGANPALFKNSGASKDNVVSFDSLVKPQTPVTTEQQALPEAITLLSGATTQAELIQFIETATPQQLQKLNILMGKSQGGGESSPEIWQFIQQQANIDSGNQIVLNLSEKGIPQDVIDDLKAMFGENDLITIIRDPKLNAQFENALDSLAQTSDTTTLNTDNLSAVVTGILNQNRGDIENTLTFSIDETQTTDEVLDILVNDASSATATFVSNETPVTPVGLSLLQSSNTIIDGGEMMIAASGEKAVNPFVPLKSDTTDGVTKSLENALNNTSERNVSGTIERQAVGMNQAQNNAQSGGNFNAAMDFADAPISANGDALMVDGEFAIPFEAAFKTASNAANPLLTQSTATQNHTATQTVALSLTKMAAKSIDGETNQKYRIKLDPPEMGRVDIEMDIAENTNKIKVVITAEKPESLGLLQRDMHALMKSLQDAGFENLNQNDLSFNLSQNNDSMADGRGGNGNAGQSDTTDIDADIIESEMTVIIDPITGQQSVNMLV